MRATSCKQPPSPQRRQSSKVKHLTRNQTTRRILPFSTTQVSEARAGDVETMHSIATTRSTFTGLTSSLPHSGDATRILETYFTLPPSDSVGKRRGLRMGKVRLPYADHPSRFHAWPAALAACSSCRSLTCWRKSGLSFSERCECRELEGGRGVLLEPPHQRPDLTDAGKKPVVAVEERTGNGGCKLENFGTCRGGR